MVLDEIELNEGDIEIMVDYSLFLCWDKVREVKLIEIANRARMMLVDSGNKPAI